MIIVAIVGLLSFFGAAETSVAQSAVGEEVSGRIDDAQAAIDRAADMIENGKDLITLIPDDSPYFSESAQMLQSAFSNWEAAVESLRGASESAQKISTAGSDALSRDYALLARVNADMAISGAMVVQIGLTYVEALASNKTEALGLIGSRMEDALEASSQVRYHYGKIKKRFSEKYSN
jgi:hypothetical protein